MRMATSSLDILAPSTEKVARLSLEKVANFERKSVPFIQ